MILQRKRFSIVTPSFNGAQWIGCCIRSVADQQLEHEHIIQDALSTDGTAECCRAFPQVRFISEKDDGMYDAINRGFRQAKGEFILHLNCDEQLLPGTLAKVATFFDRHPEAEMLFAYALVINPAGKLLCYRKTLLPSILHTQVSHLATLTGATFYRKCAIEKYGLYFDTSYRAVGDAELICRALRQKIKMLIFPEYTTAFTITGNNLSNNARAASERDRMAAQAPWIARKLRPAIKAAHRLHRLLGGVYSQGPIDYAIYTTDSGNQRRHFHEEKPDYHWKEK